MAALFFGFPIPTADETLWIWVMRNISVPRNTEKHRISSGQTPSSPKQNFLPPQPPASKSAGPVLDPPSPPQSGPARRGSVKRDCIITQYKCTACQGTGRSWGKRGRLPVLSPPSNDERWDGGRGDARAPTSHLTNPPPQRHPAQALHDRLAGCRVMFVSEGCVIFSLCSPVPYHVTGCEQYWFAHGPECIRTTHNVFLEPVTKPIGEARTTSRFVGGKKRYARVSSPIHVLLDFDTIFFGCALNNFQKALCIVSFWPFGTFSFQHVLRW